MSDAATIVLNRQGFLDGWASPVHLKNPYFNTTTEIISSPFKDFRHG